MANTPPSTGNAQLDRFLRSVADDLRTLAKPREGWRLSDFAADVSEVISDRRDLIDIVNDWESVVLKSGTTAQRPTGAAIVTGVSYFDTTLGRPIWWNGTEWVSATGASA